MARNDVVDALLRIAVTPRTDDEWNAWLDPQRLTGVLKQLAEANELILYAGLPSVFVHTVGVPDDRVVQPDKDDLLQWNLNAHDGSWSAVFGFHPPSVRVDPPLTHTSTATLERGTKLIYPRSFDGLIDERRYYELEQAFTHLMGLHYVRERRAWCRLDGRGDLDDIVRIVHIPPTAEHRGGDVVLCRRDTLDEWMTTTGSTLVQMFDMTRMRGRPSSRGSVGEMTVVADRDLLYKFRHDNDAVVVRGLILIRSRIARETLFARSGMPGGPPEERQFATFIAQDFKNGRVAEISTAPGATANYFQESDLPFETSPVFFRPEVLLRYKADTDKYTIRHRSIECRGVWHLQGFDINEENQVFTYLGDLARLPYDEQLHWKAHNEAPRAPISRRALKTDFEGDFALDEYDPLESLKQRLHEWDRRKVAWWTLRAEKLPDRVQYPVTTSADEWANELMNLHQFLIEGFEEVRLRERATAPGATPDPRWRSLKLIEAGLMKWDFDEERARAITAPFHQVHDLRIKVKGHASGNDAAEMKREAIATHSSYRKHFEALCADCDESVRIVDEVFTAEWGTTGR